MVNRIKSIVSSAYSRLFKCKRGDKEEGQDGSVIRPGLRARDSGYSETNILLWEDERRSLVWIRPHSAASFGTPEIEEELSRLSSIPPSRFDDLSIPLSSKLDVSTRHDAHSCPPTDSRPRAVASLQVPQSEKSSPLATSPFPSPPPHHSSDALPSAYLSDSTSTYTSVSTLELDDPLRLPSPPTTTATTTGGQCSRSGSIQSQELVVRTRRSMGDGKNRVASGT
ncbi:uncharacterized protein JCM6883_004671 [Sporobolomyces salmoneus]|uniref:uncharacterized protein n=1 Tax=Sporobolomyces salmoneus TaxID=183962 RepID=UPI00317688D3